MFYISNFLKLIQYKVTEGSPYLWTCFGPNARFMDSEEASYSIDCVFDSKTQRVYQIIYAVEDKVYRWTDEDYVEAFKKEVTKRLGENDSELVYVEVKSLDDFLKRVQEDVKIPKDSFVDINLTENEWLELSRIAHEKDITLNQLVNEVLRDFVNSMEKAKVE